MPNLPNISPDLLKIYQDEIAKKNSPSTLKRKNASLSKFFGWAEANGHIEENPLAGIPQASVGQTIVTSSNNRIPKSRRIFTVSNTIRLALVGGLVVLIFLLLRNVKIPIPFIKTPAQESQTTYVTTTTPVQTPPVLSASPWTIYAKLNLKDASGNPETASQNITFKIYSDKEKTSPLWTSSPVQLSPDTDGNIPISLDQVPTDIFFKNNELFLGGEASDGNGTTEELPLIPVSSANTASNVQGYTPANPQEGVNVGEIPVISKDGSLIIASEAPAIKAKTGNLLIEGQAVTISTPTASNGSITINPDGNGIAHFLFEGTGQNFLNAQAPNLTSGSLYYGIVANNTTGYNLIKLQSGSKPVTRFSVDASGNTQMTGNLNVGGSDRITSQGALTNISGYSQTSGNFTISQNPGNTATIIQKGSALADVATLNLDERGYPNSIYSTLTLKRYNGTNEAAALHVDEGNAIFDGQVQLGRYISNPDAIGQGSLIFNTTDSSVYYWNGSSWVSVGTALTVPFSGILTGTNTSAAMVMGGISSLNYTTGTINASSLEGKTWEVPGTIGSGTPNTGAFTTLSSSGDSTIGTGASSVNTIGSTTTPGTLTLHGATTLNNTFTVSGSNLTSLGGDLTVTGTAWTATPTISGLITATSGLTSNGTVTIQNNSDFTQTGSGTFGTGTGAVSLNGDTTITNQGDLRLAEGTGGGTNYVGFQAPATLAADNLYTLPPAFPGAATGYYLTADTSGVMGWSNTVTASAMKWNALTNPDGNLTLTMADKTTTWNWDSLTTGTGLTASSTSLSSGTLASLSVNSTAATGNTQKVLSLSTTGANNSQTTYGLYATNTHSGTSSTNVGGYFSASGGTNNYGLIVDSGHVGIGTTSPGAKLSIVDTSTTIPVMIDGSATGSFINFKANGTGKGYVGWTSIGDDGLAFLNAAGTIANLLVTDSGNVGIAASTPATLLHIGSTDQTTAPYGIQMGSDVNLYRGGADLLTLDASLEFPSSKSIKRAGVNYLDFNSTYLLSSVATIIQPDNATDIALITRGAVSQSANLQEWQNSGGTVLDSVSGIGVITQNITLSTPASAEYGIDQSVTVAGGTSDLSGAHRGINNAITITGSGGATNAVTGLNFTISNDNTGTMAALYGANGSINDYATSGTVTVAAGLRGNVAVRDAGNITTGASLLASAPVKASTGNIVNQYGLWINNQGLSGTTMNVGLGIDAQSGATYNYAIYTNAGLNRLGDQLSIVGSADRQQLIVKGNATQTSNLQEWQNSGGTVQAAMSGAGHLGLGTNASSSYQTYISSTNIPAINAATTSTDTDTNALTSNLSALTRSNSTHYYRGSISQAYADNFDGATSYTNSGYARGLEADAYQRTSGTTTQVSGILASAGNYAGADHTGVITTLYGVYSSLINMASASIGNAYNYYATFPTTGTVTGNLMGYALAGDTSPLGINKYGLFIGSLSGASSGNYAIYTNTGLNRLGDQLSIVGNADRQQLIVKGYSTQTSNLAEFQNNGGTPQVSITNTGNITTTGDLAVNGGDITSTGTLNVTSATVNALTLDSGTTGNVNLGTGASSKTITIGNNQTNTGISLTKGSSGNITLTGFNCSTYTNSGKLTTDTSGDIICGNDVGGGAVTGAAWNEITNPTNDLTLSHSSHTTTMNWEATGDSSPWIMNLTNNAGSATTQNFVTIANAVTSQTTDVNTEALLVLNNADTSVSGSTIVNNAILITNSGGITNGITDAIDASASEIVNAINVGPNVILGTTGTIDFTNFDVASTGYITVQPAYGLDTNAAGTLALGDITATTINIGTNATGRTIALGGTGANTVAIGNTQTGGSISLGAAMTTGTISIGGTGAQTGAIDIGTGTGAQTISLGTGGTGIKTVHIADGGAANIITIGGGAGTLAIDTGDWDIGTTGNMTGIGSITMDGSFSQTGSGTLGTGTGAISLNGDTTIAANKNLTLTSGTGTITQNYSNTTGTQATFNHTNSGSSGTNVSKVLSLAITGTDNAGGSNTITAIDIPNVTAHTGNTYYGIVAGTGLTDILRYNNTQIISGAGVLQSAGLSGTYSNALTLSSTSNALTGTIGQSTPLAGAFTSLSSNGTTNLGQGSGVVTVNSSGALNLTGADNSTWTLGAHTLTMTSSNFNLASTGVVTLAGGQTVDLTTPAGTALTIDSGTTGALNIGNQANAKTITVGNVTGATAVNVNTGTAGTTYTTTNGIFTLNTGTGNISLGTDTVAKTVSIGNTTGVSATSLNAGSGNLTLNATSGNVALTTTTSGNITLAPAASGYIVLTVPSGTGGSLCLDGSNHVVTCTSGTGDTLQTAYANGNTITTTTGRDIAFTLASGLATPTSFTLANNHISNTTDFSVANANASGTNTNGILVNQTGAGILTNGVNITQTAGTLTNGLTLTGTFTKLINSTNFNVSNAGLITAATIVNTINGAIINASTQTFSANNIADSGALTIKSNTTNALTLDSGTTGIVNLGTGTSGKTINIGTDNTNKDTINIGSTLDDTIINGAGTGSLINFANFDVATTGNITVATGVGLDTNAGSGTLALGNVNATTLNVGGSNTATAVNIGNGTGGNTINIAGTGATGVDTINVGTGATGADLITIGSTNAGASSFKSGAALTLTGGATSTWSTSTGDLNLQGAGALNLTAVNGNSTWKTTTGILTIQSGDNTTSALAINTVNKTSANSGKIAISSGTTTTTGNSGDIAITTGNAAGNSGAVSIDAGTAVSTVGTVSLGDTNATTVNIGSTAATTLNLGAGGSIARTINIGTGTGADTLNIGPTGAHGSLVFAGGSGDTGCTLDGITGNLVCSGTITASGGISASSVSFAGITTGTNAQAAMVVGAGSSLTYSGGAVTDATINANQLLGGTWAVPGTIGSTTANTGRFTSVTATTGDVAITAGNLTLNGITRIANNGTGTFITGTVIGSQTFTTNNIADSGALTIKSATTNALTLDSGTTGDINIGNSANAKNINLGTGAGAIETISIGGTGANVIALANTQTAGSLTVGNAMTGGTITIGGTAQTGNMTLGSSSGTNNLYIANGSGATTLNLANVQTAGAVNIGAGMTTGTITIGGTGQTGTITFGGGTGAQIVNLGTGGTGIKTVHIADGGAANVITIGGGAGTLAINTGDWDISTTGDMTGIGGITMDGSFSQTGSGTFGTGTGAVSLNGDTTIATNKGLTFTSGTGTITQNYSNTTGTQATFNHTNSGSSGTNVSKVLSLAITGTDNAGGSNTITAIDIPNVTAHTGNTYYGLVFGTGLTDILRYNGTQIINGSGQIISTQITGTLLTLAGDSGSDAIARGDTLTVAGGTNGIDTVESGKTVTLNLDTTEIGNATFGSGSGITWTFDASAGTDPTLAFGDNTLTVGSNLILADTKTLQVGGLTGIVYNAFANATDTPAATANITADNDLFIGGDEEIKGWLYLTGHNIANVISGTGTSTIAFASNPTGPGAAGDYNSLSYGSWLVQNNTNLGIAALMVDQEKGGNIFTASVSGTPKFLIDHSGTISGGTAANDDLTLQGTTNATRTTSYVILQPTAGNVGIGTTSPGAKLEVSGNIYFSGGADRSLLLTDMASANSNGTNLSIAAEQGGVALLSPTYGGNLKLDGGAAGTPVGYSASAGNVLIATVNTGNVGIGTTGPLSKLSVGGVGDATYAIYGTGTDGMYGDGTVTGVYGTGGMYGVSGNTTGTGMGVRGSNDSTGWGVYGNNTSSGIGGFFTSTSGYALITGTGNVGIGATNPISSLEVSNDASGSIVNSSFGTAVTPSLVLYSAEGTRASQTATQTNDILGRISFQGYDTARSEGAKIWADAPAGWGTAGDTTDDPTDLHLCTTPDGSGTCTERLTILSTGNIGIGNSAPDAQLQVAAGNLNSGGSPPDMTQAGLLVGTTTGGIGIDTNQIEIAGSTLNINYNSTNDITLANGGGNVAISTTSLNSKLTLASGGTFSGSAVSGINVAAHTVTYSDAASTTHTYFRANNLGTPTLVGTNASQTVTTASTLYVATPVASTNVTITNNRPIDTASGAYLDATSGVWTDKPSYRRLKDNFTSTAGYLDKLAGMDVYEWQYKTDGTNPPPVDTRRHAGPFLDDFYAVFGLSDDQGVNVQDYAGVALASVKELNTRFENFKTAMANQDIQLTNLGDLNIVATTDGSDSQTTYSLVNAAGNTVTQAGAFAKVLAANFQAGVAKISEIMADKITVGTKLVSPVVQTNLISPLADSTDVTVKLGSEATSSGKLSIQNNQGTEVASIDTSGQVTADSVEVNNASVSGELYANQIHSTTLDDIQKQLRDVQADQVLLSQAKTWNTSTASDSATISNNLDTLTAGKLYVTDQAAINSLSISQSIAIGTDMVIGGSAFNSINTLSAPLSLQSLAMAPIEIMAGKITIATNGNVTINADLFVAGNIESQSLTLKDTSGNETASINASGSAEFKKVTTEAIVIANSEATPSALINGNEITTNATAGKATIPSGISDIVITNPNVSDYSLIYLTPTSPTNNNVLYIKSKENGKFTVGFDNPVNQDVNFNWWIIN